MILKYVKRLIIRKLTQKYTPARIEKKTAASSIILIALRIFPLLNSEITSIWNLNY